MNQMIVLQHEGVICDTLYLILQAGKFVCGAVTQHIGRSSLYIEALDTTGHFSPRENQRNAVSSLVNHITAQDFRLFSVFSHPKKEIIFGKSSVNNKKGYLTPRKLQDFWINLFCKNQVFVFSNFCERRSIPFKRMQNVKFFNDDPKGKLNIRDVSVETFFETLLHRADFQKGSLVYMLNDKTALETNKEEKKVCMNLGKKLKNHRDCRKKNKTAEECYEVQVPNRVKAAISFLRACDFSTVEKALMSTKAFLDEFEHKKYDFKIELFPKALREEVPPTFMKPRKK